MEVIRTMTVINSQGKHIASSVLAGAGKGRRHRRCAAGWLWVLVGVVWGCAAQRPVLYPNHQLTMAGQAVAETDIDHCLALAEEYGAHASAGGEVAKDTATGAAVGGASGAAVGAVLGDFGKGAAAGAAGGAAGALTRSVIRSGEPDATFRRFVEKCLRDKGYEPIGWR